MGIPDFQSIMLPLLKRASDHQLHRVRDLIPELASEFSLTEEELDRRLPSGTQRVFDNRVFWSVTYLRKAGLLESPTRGHVKITASGDAQLAKGPKKIDIALLMQFPSFQEFRTPKPPTEPPKPVSVPTDQTPEEALEGTWAALRNSLADDLLAKVRSCSPAFFERLVLELLVKMGYGGSLPDAGLTLGGTGDSGVDGVIKEDKLGLDVVYIQAKRWEAPVGRPTVQAFAGSLEGARARKGVLITTSTFSQEAQVYVRQIEKRIVLIDGQTLVRYMMDHHLGVATAKTFEVQRIDLDYFDEE